MNNGPQRVRFGIIGGGWRAAFYLRAARECPAHFEVAGVAVRDGTKGAALEQAWGIPTYRTPAEMLEKRTPEFVVVSVPWPVTPVMLKLLAEREMPALCETPPAPDLPGLLEVAALAAGGARIQVAEQYQFQPLHAARLALLASGKLGRITQAQVSSCHGYHGVSLIRKYLDVHFETVTIRARRFTSPIVKGPTRAGPPAEEKIADSVQTIAWLDFGDRLGVYDFAGAQYMSWIRAPRVLLRGERGEIVDKTVRYLKDFETPLAFELVRSDAGPDGNLEGHYHKGILAGDSWAYRNPFVGARLTDDELAVATCLAGMSGYVREGTSFYDVAEACQDHYLGVLIDESAESGTLVTSTAQPWTAPRGQ